MSFGFQWRPYVPVAQRRANAAREVAKLTKKGGKAADPVVLTGRTIASSFWGKAWCDNLEAYSDFSNRLPRGRTYVRNGSVVDLQIASGSVTARVSGSELYRVDIAIRPLAKKLWESVRKECAGKIDSILELLQGRLSAAVMQIVTRRDRGLFPTPEEIEMECSCPDWAGMCKHVAATLYGVGARLDTRPELLFLLRGVDPEELIAGVTGADALGSATPVGAKAGLAEADLANVFGIELDNGPALAVPSSAKALPPSVSAEKTANEPPAHGRGAPRKKAKNARRTTSSRRPKGRAGPSARSGSRKPKSRAPKATS